jgi:hypothetical protein
MEKRAERYKANQPYRDPTLLGSGPETRSKNN